MFMKTLHDQSDSDKRERMRRILVISGSIRGGPSRQLRPVIRIGN
ncbi:MAG: hypothetical protein V3R83_12790 [Gammaproteobacteria bacterium]